MPKHSQHPEARKRFHGRRWVIEWKWNYVTYTIQTDYFDQKKPAFAENDRRLVSAALAMPEPVFPEKYQDSKFVRRYLENRFGKPDLTINSREDWLPVYTRHIRSKCSERWASISLSYLKKLDSSLNGIEKATPAQLSDYLADIAIKKTPATRNRTHNAFATFFKWAVVTGRMRINPILAIERVREEDDEDSEIVYCTRQEMDEIIGLARETGWEDWLAVPIAFLTGMRREEIARLKWKHIQMDAGRIKVVKTKTKESRTIPLNQRLQQYLESVPLTQRNGYVVAMPHKLKRPSRLNTLMREIRKLKRAQFLVKWGLQEVPPSRSNKYREYKARFYDHVKNDPEYNLQLKRIGWNVFRHTFGSLLAQNGKSLDKICAWMGNTPKVCRKHYAQFIPRDRRDEDIDAI